MALSGARVEEGKADVALARAQLNKCKVQAPYAGQVVKRIAQEYESVDIGAPLIAILEDRYLEMTLNAPSRLITSLVKGIRFRVSIDETGRRYHAEVLRVNPKIDPTSRTFNVTAGFVDTHPELRAGMTGDAMFVQP